MTSLESIVLPLAECQVLVEKGIVLETAAYWQRSVIVIGNPVSVHIKGDNAAWCVEDFFEDICPAPTLSELLDAIRAKHPDVNFEIYDTPHGQRKIQAWMNNDVDEVETEGDTDLLAAHELLMEVSK